MDLLFRLAGWCFDGGVLDVGIYVERGTAHNNEHQYGAEEVGPDIDTLVVYHEEGANNFLGGIEVNAISTKNVKVIYHILWSLFDGPYELCFLGSVHLFGRLFRGWSY